MKAMVIIKVDVAGLTGKTCIVLTFKIVHVAYNIISIYAKGK